MRVSINVRMRMRTGATAHVLMHKKGNMRTIINASATRNHAHDA